MTQGSTEWLLDTCLPHGRYDGIEALHVDEISRLPGPAGLREARALGRTLVTCADEFRGPCSLSLDHPGVVVLEQRPTDRSEVVRNLRHLEFRLSQYNGALSLASNRYLVRTDREVFRILDDGTEVELEPWQQVRLQRAPAMAV